MLTSGQVDNTLLSGILKDVDKTALTNPLGTHCHHPPCDERPIDVGYANGKSSPLQINSGNMVPYEITHKPIHKYRLVEECNHECHEDCCCVHHHPMCDMTCCCCNSGGGNGGGGHSGGGHHKKAKAKAKKASKSHEILKMEHEMSKLKAEMNKERTQRLHDQQQYQHYQQYRHKINREKDKQLARRKIKLSNAKKISHVTEAVHNYDQGNNIEDFDKPETHLKRSTGKSERGTLRQSIMKGHLHKKHRQLTKENKKTQ